MSFQRKWIRAFLTELPKLRASGVIDEVAEERLRSHYEAQLTVQKDSAQRIFQLSLVILGAVLIGGGVILLFNYNWEMLPKCVRILVSALPLASGAAISLYTLVHEKTAVWREVSAIWTAVGGAVLIALLSQIYQIHGQFFDYIALVLACALSLIYIFDSKGLAILYQVFLFGLFSHNYWHVAPGILLTQIILSLAFLPWLLWKLRCGTSAVRVLARYLVIAMVIYQSVVMGCSEVRLGEFYCVLLGCTFILLAMRLAEQGEHGFRNPWGSVAYLLLLVVLVIGNCIDERLGLLDINHYEWKPALVLSVGYYVAWLVVLGTLAAWQFYCSWRNKTLHGEKIVLGAITLGVLLEGLLNLESIYLYMLALVAWGVVKLWRGVRQRNIRLFNSGLVIIVVFMVCRFVSSDFGLLERGAGFIVTGIAFLVANVLFSRACRRAQNDNPLVGKEVEQ